MVLVIQLRTSARLGKGGAAVAYLTIAYLAAIICAISHGRKAEKADRRPWGLSNGRPAVLALQ